MIAPAPISMLELPLQITEGFEVAVIDKVVVLPMLTELVALHPFDEV